MGKILFPVAGKHNFSDTWGAYRADIPGGHHQGTDIFAAKGTPVIAVVAGRITKMGPSKIGGNRVWINGTWYYAHLDHFAKGIEVGTRVRAGQVIGYVGNTGDARGTPFHLHFGWDPHGTQGNFWQNPYPALTRASVSPTVPSPQAQTKVASRTSSTSGGSLDAVPSDQAFQFETRPYQGFDFPAAVVTDRPAGLPQSDIHQLWGTVISSPNLSPETRDFWARMNQGRAEGS